VGAELLCRELGQGFGRVVGREAEAGRVDRVQNSGILCWIDRAQTKSGRGSGGPEIPSSKRTICE
jgi:hypothetical protein